METPKFADGAHLLRCFAQLGMWALQDVLMAVDDAIVELPDV